MSTNQLIKPVRHAPLPIKKKKKRVRKPGTKRPLSFRIAIILFIGALILGVFKLWACLNVIDPHLNYIEVTRNGEGLVLLDGETALFHPSDRLRITDISTNMCFDRGMRIASEGIDANSLIYEEILLSDLLPDKDIYSSYTFRLDVKSYNMPMGHIYLVIEPLVEDWLNKAERTIENNKRIEVLKQAQELFPEERQIKDKLVKEYISLQKWEDAARMLEVMVKEHQDQETYSTLLDVYTKMSNDIGVISVLRKMINLAPDDTDLKIRLAEALKNAGREGESITVYEELINSIKGQDLLPVYNNLGYLYAETGDNEKAISFYLKALKLNEDDVNIYHNLSLLYEKTGQKDKANEYLAKVVELKPDSPDDRLKLAENILEAGKTKEAETLVEEFIKENPGSMDAWLLITRIAEKNGDKSLLKTAYENILAINPQTDTVIYNLGIMEYEAGNTSKALSYFEKYINFAPNDGTAHAFLFEIYRSQKKDDSAYKEASAIIRLRPDETECWKYIFDYLRKKEKYDEIASIMENGIKTRPKDIALRKYLVTAYLKLDKTNQAITQMKAALELNPKDTDMLMQLAKIYEKQNEPNKALDTYKKILDINPDNAEAQEAYLRLRLKTISK